MKSLLSFLLILFICVEIQAQSGRVGIGIDNPSSLLHLEGDPNSLDHLLFSRVNRIENFDYRAIEGHSVPNPGYGIGGYFTGGYRGVYALNSGGNYSGSSYGIYSFSNGNTGTRIGLYSAASGGTLNLAARFGQGDVEVQNALRIGTTAQSGRLNITNTNTLWAGSAVALRVNSSNTVSGTTYGARITTSSSANADVFGLRVTADKTGGSGFSYGLHSQVSEDDGWAFYSVGKNYMSNDLRIGTTSDPDNGAYRLIVNGSVLAEGLRIQNSNQWPDYVFASDYQLMPLTELEESIKQNKHLPNIPPASQVEAEGIEVGDMQIRMMEKIEELTLYIIDLEKRIASLETDKQ